MNKVTAPTNHLQQLYPLSNVHESWPSLLFSYRFVCIDLIHGPVFFEITIPTHQFNPSLALISSIFIVAPVGNCDHTPGTLPI
jgi:hypothetical protein